MSRLSCTGDTMQLPTESADPYGKNELKEKSRHKQRSICHNPFLAKSPTLAKIEKQLLQKYNKQIRYIYFFYFFLNVYLSSL